jgi:predicted transcriptional regulator
MSPSPGDYQKAILRALSDGPRTVKQLEREVAARVGVSDESPVEAQLDAMVSAGVVVKNGGKFSLSDSGEALAPYVPEPATN